MANIFTTLLTLLGVKHTKAFANKSFEEHPYKYSLFGVTDLLALYNVENIAYSLDDKDEIRKLKPPFIAQISDEFSLVTALTEDNVKFIWQQRTIDMPTEEFKNLWTGVVLLAEKNENSIEPGYVKHIRRERFKIIEKVALVGLILLIAALILIDSNQVPLWEKAILLTVNCLGLGASYMLLLKQMRVESKSADKICALFSKSDCNDILETQSAKFLGVVGWSEIGFCYFLGNIITAILFPTYIGYLALINILALPYSIWSVWYQKYRAKQWCALCLIVQVVLWMLFICNCALGFLRMSTSEIQDLLIIVIIFAVPLLIVNLVLSIFIDARKTSGLLQKYESMKMKDEVFSTLLKSQPFYRVDRSTSSIVFGYPDAKMRVTILTNPHCNPCANMHRKVDELLDAVGGKLCVQYIFSSFNDELQSSAEYLIALYLNYQDDTNFVRDCYDQWFAKGKLNREQYFAQHKEDISEVAFQTEYRKHNEWIEAAEIHSTPTVIVNGYILPNDYSILDLKYFVHLDFASPINLT